MKQRVAFHPSAQKELDDLYDYVAEHASPATAWKFVAGIRDYCLGLSAFPERGRARPDLITGIRIVGYRRRVSIAFCVEEDRVLIVGVFYGGQNITPDVLEGRN